MTPDTVDETFIEAFASEGFQVRFVGPMTLSISLPGVSDFVADISEVYTHIRQAPAATRPELAADFAAAFARGHRKSSQTAEGFAAVAGADVEQLLAEEALRVRIYPEDALAQPPDMRATLVSRALAPGLVEAVAIDTPNSIALLPRSTLGGRAERQVFGAALHASLTREPFYAMTKDVMGVPITCIGETHRYIGSRIHVLSRYLGPAPYGALVSFPLPEYLLVHEIGAAHLVKAMEAMQEFTGRVFEQGDKAISAQLYWWQSGPYEQVPEQDRLTSGEVPDLRPVNVEVDHQKKSITPLTADTGVLLDRWMGDNA